MMIQFEGGPIDGATLTMPDGEPMGEVTIGISVSVPGDPKNATSHQNMHRYGLVNSTGGEGVETCHFLYHIGVCRIDLKKFDWKKMWDSKEK